MTKEELAKIGEDYIYKFCDKNNIKPPKIRYYQKQEYNASGFYEWGSGVINVCLENCSKEYDKPGYGWSHRYYFLDKEPCGTLCHEFGHYLDDYIYGGFCYVTKPIKVSSYEPDILERFAETTSLFILHPDLLKNYNYSRYNIFINVYKLKPIFDCTWQELYKLKNMDIKYFKATENRLKNKLK